MLIRAQVKLGMVSEASKEFEIIKQKHGNTLQVQMLAAHIAASQGDFNTAKDIYESLLKVS